MREKNKISVVYDERKRWYSAHCSEMSEVSALRFKNAASGDVPKGF